MKNIRKRLATAVIALAVLGSIGVASAATASSTTAKPARCTTGHLQGKLQTGDGGAAGTVTDRLWLKNTGKHSCTLQGWPGVSFVGHGNGTQIGKAAKMDRATVHSTVVIKPGMRVVATLKIAQAANYPISKCGSRVNADGLRVYPPGSKTSIFVASAGLSACSSSSVSLLTVSALR